MVWSDFEKYTDELINESNLGDIIKEVVELNYTTILRMKSSQKYPIRQTKEKYALDTSYRSSEML